MRNLEGYNKMTKKESIMKYKDNKTIIHNLSDYINFINELYEHNDCSYYFRGHSDKDYEIIPSLARNSKGNIIRLERNLIESTKFKLPDIFKDNLSPIDLLGLLQHYGIPTRLLDITANPLVALFFACNEKDLKEGEVIVFKNNQALVANSPLKQAIADSYRLLTGKSIREGGLQSFYELAIKQHYFEEQLYIKKFFEKNYDPVEWINSICQKTLFVSASWKSMRQRNQEGKFILFNNDITDDKTKFSGKISPISKNDDVIESIIIIDAAAKEKILKELERVGINRGTLFPDNIDIICEEIKKTYL